MKKKILLVIPHLKMGGGAEKIAAELGTSLSNRGHDVTFLTIYDERPMYDFEGKHICFNEKRGSSWPKKIFKALNIPRKIANVCKQENIDTVISFIKHTNISTINSKILFRNKAKIIVTIHNNPLKSRKKIISLMRKMYPRADLVVVISSHIDYILKNNYSIENTKLIYNLHNIDKFEELGELNIEEKHKHLFDDGFIFLTMGRLTEQKSHWYLIRSFKKVSNRRPNSKLIIKGDGELKEELIKLVNKLELEENVFFLDRVEHVFPYLNRADCFVLSSLWEGLPNVLIEALSQNLPIISTDCISGPREILCPELGINEDIKYPYMGQYGILTEPFEHNIILKTLEEEPLSKPERILAETMIKMLDDKKLKDKYSKGLSRARDFDIENIVKEWEKIL